MRRLGGLLAATMLTVGFAGGAWAASFTVTEMGLDARAVNNAGQVVGTNQGGAFIWQNGTMRTILYGAVGRGLSENGYVGWVLRLAYDINDSDQIVGQGVYNGQTRGFLLTPIPSPTSTPVPESSTLLVLGSGLGLLAIWRRKQ